MALPPRVPTAAPTRAPGLAQAAGVNTPLAKRMRQPAAAAPGVGANTPAPTVQGSVMRQRTPLATGVKQAPAPGARPVATAKPKAMAGAAAPAATNLSGAASGVPARMMKKGGLVRKSKKNPYYKG